MFPAHCSSVSGFSVQVRRNTQFTFIPYEWTTSGGLYGAIPFYTVLFIAIVAMILRGSLRTLMVVAVLAVDMLLTGYDILGRGLSWKFV
jgi:hypothetical protein